MLVASPRNHFNLQREVAGFGRPLRICGGAQHRRQIPLQFDSELAVSWREDDGLDEPSQRLGGFGFYRLSISTAGKPSEVVERGSQTGSLEPMG